MHVVLFTCGRFNASIYDGVKTTTYFVVDWSIGRSWGRNKTSRPIKHVLLVSVRPFIVMQEGDPGTTGFTRL